MCKIEEGERGISDDEEMLCLGRGRGGVDNSVSQTQTIHNNRLAIWADLSRAKVVHVPKGRKGLLVLSNLLFFLSSSDPYPRRHINILYRLPRFYQPRT